MFKKWIGNSPLVLACLFGCVEDDALDDESMLRSASLITEDPDNDGVLSPGEVTRPIPQFEHKKICSQDIVLEWSACMLDTDAFDQLEIGEDLNNERMCGDFKTNLDCINYELFQGKTECIDGVYCQLIISGASFPGQVCGWKITDLEAKNAKNDEVLERFNQAFIAELGFELLPLAPM